MTAELPERALRMGRALHVAGGRATVAELRAQTAMGQTTAAQALAELEAAGLVERLGGAKGTPRLTAAGAACFAGVEPVRVGAAIDAAAAVWPYTQAAFLRLYLAAIVVRHHRGPEAPHLGFVTVGEPRTGKSALFGQVCHLLGLDVLEHTRDLGLMTLAELTGRRSVAGATVTYRPPAYLGRPLVLLDEFDKADTALRGRAQKLLLQGQFRTPLDDAMVTVTPTPMFAANLPTDTADRFGHLEAAFRTKRCVLLDAGAMREQLRDLGPRLRGYYANHQAGQLVLDKIVPPAHAAPSAVAIWQAVQDTLMPARRDEFPDERALDLLALGYAALRGCTDDDADGLDLAAIYAAIDWHACASTVPGLLDHDGAPLQVQLEEAHRQLYSGRSDFASLEAALAAQDAGAQARAVAARERTRARVRVADDVVRGRGELAEQLRLAAAALDARKVPDPHKATAAGLRSVLGKQRTQAQLLTLPESLDEARLRAEEPLAEADALAARIVAERAATQRARDDARAVEQQSRREAAAATKQQTAYQRQLRSHAKAQARAQLTAAREVLKALEQLYRRTRTKPDESPLSELAQLNVVHYQADPAVAAIERPKGWRRMFAGPDPWPGNWVAHDGSSYPGSPRQCPALASWVRARRRCSPRCCATATPRRTSSSPAPARSHAPTESVCRRPGEPSPRARGRLQRCRHRRPRATGCFAGRARPPRFGASISGGYPQTCGNAMGCSASAGREPSSNAGVVASRGALDSRRLTRPGRSAVWCLGVDLVLDDLLPAGQRRVRPQPADLSRAVLPIAQRSLVDCHRQRLIHRHQAAIGQLVRGDLTR